MLVIVLWWLLSQGSKRLFYWCALKDLGRLFTGAFTRHHSNTVIHAVVTSFRLLRPLPCGTLTSTPGVFSIWQSHVLSLQQNLLLTLPSYLFEGFPFAPTHMAWDKVNHSPSLIKIGGKYILKNTQKTKHWAFTSCLQRSLCGIPFYFTR